MLKRQRPIDGMESSQVPTVYFPTYLEKRCTWLVPARTYMVMIRIVTDSTSTNFTRPKACIPSWDAALPR